MNEPSQVPSLAEKVGQLFMPAAFINDTEDQIRRLESLISDQAIGGLCFFHSRASAATNFEGKKKVVRNEASRETLIRLIQRYRKASRYPLLIAIDAEWGLAMRIENTPQYPYALTLGALPDSDDHLIHEVGRNIARDCRSVGIHWNLAPDVDVNVNPENPVIGYRSFGEDPVRVARKAMAFAQGSRAAGVATCLKHFPGHGDTATDSHLGLPVVTKTRDELEAVELLPFRNAIAKGAEAVMIGHLAVPALTGDDTLPATISESCIGGVLRQEMGFEGVVITDALNMHAISLAFPVKGELEFAAFNAGNDILCFSENPIEGIRTILEKATETQIEAAFDRVWEFKRQVIPALEKSDTRPTFEPDGLNAAIARKCITEYKCPDIGFANWRENTFEALEVSATPNLHFFNKIAGNLGRPVPMISRSYEALADRTSWPKQGNPLLLALFLPQVKPKDAFGLSRETWDAINSLIRGRKTLLYLFGNPYALRHITMDHAEGIVLAYQDFPEFQQAASDHFCGRFEAVGRLPVTLNQ